MSLKRIPKRALVGVIIGVGTSLLLMAQPSEAQVGSSAASLEGTVRDTSGGAMPGVTVEVTSPALIEKVRTAITGENGRYEILELPSGTYSISFSLPGFSTFVREGVSLGAGFTGTVNAEMTVGSLEETIVVSGQSPLVDTSNVSASRVITAETLEVVPTSKSILSLAALMPAAVTPPSSQDVGGSKGEVSVRMSVHGTRPGDQRQMIDGMSYNSLFAQATGRGFYVNPLSMDEVVIDPARAGSAEYTLGGTVVNAIPRAGANTFSASLFTALTSHQLQGDNYTDELEDQGLDSVNGIRGMEDYNFGVGGPVIRDKMWFYTAHRLNRMTTRTANLFADSLPNDYRFVPDESKPVDPVDSLRSHTLRLNWQASTKDTINFFIDYQRNETQDGLRSGNTALEASRAQCVQPVVTQGSWMRPQTNQLLFEGGISFLKSGYYSAGSDLFLSDFEKCGNYYPDRVAVQDTGLGLRHNGDSERRKAQILLMNARWSASYLTGGHQVKAGLFWGHTIYHKLYQDYSYIDPLPVSYRFTNGVPNQVTQFVDSVLDSYGVRPDLGLYIQDRWRLDRLTLNLGLRYDYIAAYVPANDRPAGLLVDAASFPALDCLPCWHDISPRASAVYDVFGNGKTAVKFGMGRYLLTTAANIAQTFNPTITTVNSTSRAWNDNFYPVGDPRRGNVVPDCDLRNVGRNEECGPLANQSFGQTVTTHNPDPEWITGYGKRAYNWQASVSVDHELIEGLMAINAGYYRTWYGNFDVRDNLAVTPDDYDHYCIPVPVDDRLPADVSGSTICGLYDIKPDKFGQIDSIQTSSEKYGKQTEYYNGADLNFSMRLPHGATASGGWNVGNSISISQNAGFSATNRCFVVDSPGEMRFCEQTPPYQHRVKMSGSYPLPWQTQVAAVYQNIPTSHYQANWSVPNAVVAQSLGRPLSGGAANVSVPLIEPFSTFVEGRISQLDLRLTKIFSFTSRGRIQANFDVYNLFNANTVLTVNQTYGANFLVPQSILEARLMKFSFQVDF